MTENPSPIYLKTAAEPAFIWKQKQRLKQIFKFTLKREPIVNKSKQAKRIVLNKLKLT